MQYLFVGNISRYHYLIYSQIYVLINLFSMIMISYGATFGIMYSIMISLTIRIKQDQLDKLLKSQHRYKFILFRRAYIKSLIHLSKSNKSFGKLYLVTLLIQFPMNCISILLYFSIENIILKSWLITLIIFQLVFIMGIHLMLARLNADIANSSKQMMKRYIHQQDPIVRSIRMNLFIQTYFTNKQYGISYGSFRIVSMITYTKVFLHFLNLIPY